MKSSKYTLHTQYIGDIIQFNIRFDFPLTKQEKKNFKNIFLAKRDLNEEKLIRYQDAIERFISNRIELTRLLHKSEVEYKRLQFKDSSEKTFNSNLKREFIKDQWREYNGFFMRNPRFREIITKIVKSHLEQRHSINVEGVHEYSLRDDLLLLIKDNKYLIKNIKEKGGSLKKELRERIKGWEDTQAFLPSIFRNCSIVSDESTITIEFNVKELYENIFTYLFKVFSLKNLLGLGHRLKKPIKINEDRFYIYEIGNPLFFIYLNRILEEQKSELKKYCEIPFTYSKENEVFLFRFNFEEVIKGICREFSNEREIWKKPTISLPHSKENILQKAKIALPIVVIIIIVGVVTALFVTIPTIKVEIYDSVKIDYIVWESDEDENYDELSPAVDVVLWVTMIPITENESTGLVLGLYNNLFGKKINYDSGLVWLNKCIDQNRDGIDDVTGQVALTYGNSTDLYFNTCLMIKFKILDIDKYSPSSSLDPEKNIILYILGYVAISIGGLLALILAIFYGSRYLQKRKLRPRLVSKKPTTRKLKVFKYGLLAALLPTIAVITISIINIVTPFSEILFSNEYNPYVLPVVIGFIITICIISIPIYFVLFGLLHRKFENYRN